MAILFNVTDGDRAQSISDRLTENWTPIGAVSPELPGNIVSFISSFEIQSHFVVRNPSRALDLIRRSWGWYINNPNGTGSTVIEGYLANGTFGSVVAVDTTMTRHTSPTLMGGRQARHLH